MGATVTSNAGDILRRFDKLPAEIQSAVIRRTGEALRVARGKVRSSAALKWRRGARGLAGRLSSYAVRDRYLGMDAAIGFRKTRGFPYELAQEFGATAKPGRAMAIPLSSLARRLSDRGLGPRKFPRALFIPPNMHVLAEGYKRMPGIKEIHYALVKSIAPRLRFLRTMEGELPRISAEIEAGGKEALRTA